MDNFESDSFFSRLLEPFRYVRRLYGMLVSEDGRLGGDKGIGGFFLSLLTLPFRLLFAGIVFMVQAWTTSRNGFAFLRGFPAVIAITFFLAALWAVSYFNDAIVGGNFARYFVKLEEHPDKPLYAHGYIDKAVQLIPGSVEFKYQLALSRERIGDKYEARNIMRSIAIGDKLEEGGNASGIDKDLTEQLARLNYDVNTNATVSNAHYWLGADFLLNQEIDEDQRHELAKNEFELALKVNDENLLAKFGLANYYERIGDTYNAIEMLEKLIYTGDMRNILKIQSIPRMISLLQAEQTPEQLQQWRERFPVADTNDDGRLSPGEAEVFFSAESKNRLDRALDVIQPLARDNPDYFQLWGALVDAAIINKDYDLANRITDDALQYAKATLVRDQLSRLKAVIFVRGARDIEDTSTRDKFVERLYNLCESVKASPSSPDAYEELIKYMHAPKSSDDPTGLWLRDSIVGCPFPAVIHILLGFHGIETGDFPMAQRRWKQAELHFGLSQYLVNNMIEAYTRVDNSEQAMNEVADILAVAMEMFPDQPVYFQTRGRLRNRLGEYESALPDFQRALEKEPRLVTARIGLVEAYRGLQQHEDARSELLIIRSEPSGLNEFQNTQLEKFLTEQQKLDDFLLEKEAEENGEQGTSP